MNRQMVCDYIKKKYRVEPERPWPPRTVWMSSI